MSIPDIREAQAFLERDAVPEAVDVLEALVALFPRYAAAHVLLARSYEALGRWQAATATWQAASFLVPNSPVVHAGIRRAARGARKAAATPKPPAPKPEPAETEPADVFFDVEEAERVEEAEVEETPDASAEVAELDEPEVAEGDGTTAGEEEEPALAEPRSRQDDGFSISVTQAKGAQLHEYDDLDRLIESLEDARIVPRPDFESIPAPDLEDEIDDMVSETLARIYAAQQQFEEAARVYEALARQQPDRADEYHAQAAQMRARGRRGMQDEG